MTGLNVDSDVILEISCQITDKTLMSASRIYNAVIHQDNKTLRNMNEWCQNQHWRVCIINEFNWWFYLGKINAIFKFYNQIFYIQFKSGLKQEVAQSQVTLRDAESSLLEFIKEYAPEKMCPMAGNSVYTDRLFIKKYMPMVVEYLNDEIIDVTSIIELCRWV